MFITCHVISPQLTVQCHSQKKAPCGMHRGSAVTDQKTTYCTPYYSYSLYRYTMTEDKWEELRQCPYRNSGLVVIDSALTAVGGYDGSFTNKLFTLRQSRWVEEYPPMNTVRSSPAVVSTSDGGHMNVIAIGGDGDGGWIDAVELLHTGRRSWSQLTSLPQPLTLPLATICGNQLHVIGRDGDGYSCFLQALLSTYNLAPGLQYRTPTWTPLPCLPVEQSTAATLCGQLVIIGGEQDRVVKSIHQLVDGQWVNIGSMSSGRKWCLVASPSPDKIVVVGGLDAFTPLDSVEVCVAV